MRRTFLATTPTLLLCLWLLLIGLANQAIAAAPITPSGLNTQVSQNGQAFNITGGTRPGGGTNLFHSFGDFNVPNHNIANFLNDSGLATSNILGRVTGGNMSNIFGTVQTTGFGNANLFLMNPAGFLFGPNATVSVGGMVSFSSADYLRLADGKLFNAIPNAASDALLSAAPVAAYGFLGSNPGAIRVQGSQLTVLPGQSLSLVGGNITIQSGKLDDGGVQSAKLSAQGGQVNLASVASPGELLATTLAQAPNINGQSFANMGAVQITEQSLIDVSGNGGGTVLIRGGNFILDNSTISANVTGPGPIVNGVESLGGGIDLNVSGTAVIQNLGVLESNVTGNATPGVQYGGVHVKADRLEIIGTVSLDDGLAGADIFTPFTGIRSDVRPGSTGGNSGAITVEANSVLVKNLGTVETVTEGAGNAGDLIVRANQNIDFDFAPNIQSAAHPGSTGDAGHVELSSAQGSITLTNFSGIASQVVDSPGTSGGLTMSAPNGNIVLTDFTANTYLQPPVNGAGIPAIRAGGSGAININAKNLELHGGDIGIINLSNLPAGDITINVSGSLTMNGGVIFPGPSSIHASTVGLLVNGSVQGTASSSGLNIKAHDIHLSDGSFLTTDTNSSGAAGPLNISAATIELTNGSQIASKSRLGIDPLTNLPVSTPPSGPAGTVTIQGLSGPAQSVLIDGQDSGVFTTTVGTGRGGNINILANNVTLQNNGSLSAASSGTSPSATGGTISVKADTINLNTGGTMTATSTGAGAAGQIIVQGIASPAQSVLIDGAASGIFSDTHGTGAGGNVSVSANSVTLQNGGSLSAVTSGTAPSATGGTITVNANQVEVNSGGLITAATTGAGPGGSVNINAGNTYSSNAGIVSSTTTQAAGGGNINIAAGNAVTLSNGASISASSTGQGSAGDIHINAGNFTATNSSVTTEASHSTGGIIKITTAPNGTVQLTDSTISASVLDGSGGGGSVNIDPQFVILENSQIIANSVFGPGGNINITTNLLLPDTASAISASSQFGQQGNIVIQSPISPASGKILPLSQRPLVATTLLSQRCAALAGGNVSSFTVAGRDSLPAEPGGWVSSPLALLVPALDEALQASGDTGTEQRIEPPVVSVRKIAPAGFLTQSFAGSTDCAS